METQLRKQEIINRLNGDCADGDELFPDGTETEECDDGNNRGIWDFLNYYLTREEAVEVARETGLTELIED